MKKRTIRVLSLLLTLVMFLSVSTTGFALGGGDIGGGWDRDIGEDEVRDFGDFEPEEEEEELDYFQALDEETLAQVTVEAPMGSLPTLAELRLESIPTADLRDAVDALVGGSPEILLAMDISFWLGDDEIEPEEPVRVRITSPELEGKRGLQVIHFPDNAEEPETVELIGDEDLSFALGTNEVAFRADSFSTYVVTWPGEEEDEKESATIYWGYMAEGGAFTEFSGTASLDSNAASMNLNVVFEGYLYSSARFEPGKNSALYPSQEGEEGEEGGEGGDSAEPVTYFLDSPILTKVTAEGGAISWTARVRIPSTETEGEYTVRTVTLADGDEIYALYQKEPEAYAPPSPAPSTVHGPETDKKVEPNGDGTYKIRLDVTGHVDHTETKNGANVIVVMDITNSMGQQMPDGGTRMAAARTALNTLINTLDPDTNLINFTAVNFGNSYNFSNPSQLNNNGYYWTTSKTTMQNYVTNGLSTNDYGTCWQAGLYGAIVRANQAKTDTNLSKNKTYIIFVTDGNPNAYYENVDSNGGPVGNSNNAVGWHQEGNGYFVEDAYKAAVPNALRASALCNYNFYGIFCGSTSDMVHLEDLMGYNDYYADIPGEVNGHFIDGTSAAAIKSAFEGIAYTIVNDIGASNVGVDDGIPEMADVSASVSGSAGGFAYYISYPLTPVTSGTHSGEYSYTYKNAQNQAVTGYVTATEVAAAVDRNGENYQVAPGIVFVDEKDEEGQTTRTYYKTEAWENAPSAGYTSDNGVTWNMANAGVLADQTIYTLEFDVWPSQEAYDLLANLNNNMEGWTLDKLDDDTLEQLVVTVNGNEYTYTRGETAGSGTWSSKTASGTYPTSTGENSFLALINSAGEDNVLYNIMTNTHLLTSYDYNGTSYTDPPKDGLVSGAMLLQDQTIGIIKYWHNDLDAHGAEDVSLTITRDQKPYMDVKLGTATKLSAHEWVQQPDVDIYISCGIMTVDSSNKLTLNTTGHDYSVVENEGSPWYWDLTAYTYHPMVINSKNTMLILVTDEVKAEEDFPSDITDTNPANLKRVVSTENGKTYYRFDNKLYVEVEEEKDEYGNVITNMLRADNDRRSSLEISKVVTGSGATGDELFTFEITMNNLTTPVVGDERYNADYHTFWFVVLKDLDADPEDPAWDDIALVEDGLSVEGAKAEILELRTDNVNITDITTHAADETYPYDYITYKYKGTPCTVKAVDLLLHSGTEDIDGETNNYSYYSYYTGYYWFDNLETAQKVTAKIKGGWKIGFTSVTKNTVYTVEEPTDKLLDGFLLAGVECDADCNRQGEDATEAVVNEDNPALVEGTIDNSNSWYTVSYTNKYEGYFYVYHSSDCSVERFLYAKNGVPVYSKDKYFDITVLTAANTLYGGYYEDYLGRSKDFDAAAAAALKYTDNKASDVLYDETDAPDGAKAYTTDYIKEVNNAAWASADAYTTNGKQIIPTANTVYFLKEVPDTAFLLPRLRYTYKQEGGVIGTSWLITNIDDANYGDVGFMIADTKVVGTKATTVTLVPTRFPENAVTYVIGEGELFTDGYQMCSAMVYNNENIYSGDLAEYNLPDPEAWGGTDPLVAGAAVTMFWVTPDGLKVTGIQVRTYSGIDKTSTIQGTATTQTSGITVYES